MSGMPLCPTGIIKGAIHHVLKRTCFLARFQKYCDVIVKRYIDQVGSEQDVTLERDGKTIPYSEVVKRDK